MSRAPNNRFGFSEEEMGNAFAELLRSRKGLPGIGAFWRVFRDVDCFRGRPDFVAVAADGRKLLREYGPRMAVAASAVLSLLKPRAPRSAPYLVRKSGFSDDTVRRVLAELVTHHGASRTESGNYLLGSAGALFEVEAWAFELKLDNPRRAVFQAQQYRVFAQRVVIVVPPRQVALFAKHDKAMKRWGIGLASFDPRTCRFALEAAPRYRKPASKQHQVYAMFRLLDRSRSQ